MSHKRECVYVCVCIMCIYFCSPDIQIYIYLTQSSHSHSHTRCLPSGRKDGYFHTTGLRSQFTMAAFSVVQHVISATTAAHLLVSNTFSLWLWFNASLQTLIPLVYFASLFMVASLDSTRHDKTAARTEIIRFASAERCAAYLSSWKHIHLMLWALKIIYSGVSCFRIWCAIKLYVVQIFQKIYMIIHVFSCSSNVKTSKIMLTDKSTLNK